jgi:hypothetical protein
MDNITVLPVENISLNFIPNEFLPAGKDEYYLRNSQTPWTNRTWRPLLPDEVEALTKNNNTAENWQQVLVTDPFDPAQISNSHFYGLVRIGRLSNVVLDHHDLRLSAGINNSVIIACDIGDDAAIHNVRHLAHYIIGDRCILFNIDEMLTTDHAKFGNGVIKQGEPEDARLWIELMNEAGGRKVAPFDGMLPADAYLWARYRDDRVLQDKLKKMTQNSFDSRRGLYGTVGAQCVIKHSRMLKDVKVGPHCYIKGANKLKNLTINSSEAEPTHIGEGVELVNGIIGYGCSVFYGCKAVRFVLGDNANLKYGARLIDSFLGDNSTVSCCEVLNNLIFPAHEQHHNNSFLIASLVMGQSNIAAGATIGSNHNSRSNDNEIQAGRGFWPGLCVSLKHPSRFASFILIAKGDYPAELDIPLPFSLLNNNVATDQLEVMPAYWWLYNMCALARNGWKFQHRDKRVKKSQHIEFDWLAPDTVEEIFCARRLLEIWTAKAAMRKKGESADNNDEQKLAQFGHTLLLREEELLQDLEVLGERMEKSKRKVVIIKTREAYYAYGDMLHYYAVKNLLEYLEMHPQATFHSMCEALIGSRERGWINLGGQLVPGKEVDQLRRDIGSGKLTDWTAIHRRYDLLWEEYPLEKQKHAFATLCELLRAEHLTKEQWESALDRVVDIQKFINDQVYISRKKDFDNPFRQATYRNDEEMNAVTGTIEDDSFIRQVCRETEDFERRVRQIKKRR